MKYKKIAGPLTVVLMLLAGFATAENPATKSESIVPNSKRAYAEQMALDDILKHVSRESDKVFLVHNNVPAKLTVGPIGIDKIDYPALLSVLRNNRLAAVELQGKVNIIPEAMIRQHALPIVNSDNPAIADDAWVTRILVLKNANVPQLVPILRPLLVQAGHLSAEKSSNSLMIVGRYANVKRLTELAMTIDKNSAISQ